MSNEDCKMPWEEFDEHYHPKHYLFMSIDAIGSTQLKTSLWEAQKEDSFSPYPWVSILLDFLPETQVIYAQHYNELVKNCPAKVRAHGCSKNCNIPKVWKFIGDEVVLFVQLDCQEQVYYNILALRNVIHSLNSGFLEKKRHGSNSHLEFKATAWVAAFPVTNVEVILPLANESSTSTIKDFIGPSIDLGFRLAKHATKSRLVISASLAKLLNDLSSQVDLVKEPLQIFSGGFVPLKGVRGGRHPLFWIYTKDADNIEQELLSCISVAKLNEFFSRFFGDKYLPFILKSGNYHRDYVEHYSRSVEELKGLKYSVFSSNDSIGDSQSSQNPSQVEDIQNDISKKLDIHFERLSDSTGQIRPDRDIQLNNQN